ncbi:hypothetical protein SD70_08115 [Gordoniibacillus kamchatkensis]|uniref:Uncharacterized protein n=1 Tax=Gordoniibacillus kamchatkensis TaxID=1590651 RepID=A0ABR5AJL7_9BACL|nr:hypothetical protein [Paenibacillus sp. VKM B-2647]KIL41221.1 hypothetical protein SD70_08115 [Paenibacillus sp. VKM B-2647]
MWIVYLFVFGVLAAFIALDMFASRLWDVFAMRSYDMLNMVGGDRASHPSWFHRRGEEYENKTRCLRNP